MVTQSPRRSGSITVSHTRCAGASILIFTWTTLIGVQTLPCREWLGFLPLPQRMFDRTVQGVNADAKQFRRAIVARQQVVLEALHQGPDQCVVLARDHRCNPACDWSHRQTPEADRRSCDEH